MADPMAPMIITTPRGMVQLFASRLGVQPRLPRRMVREIKRANNQARYRAAEKRAIAVAKGTGPQLANGLFDHG